MTCGHTHLAMVAAHDGVLYINSGTWTEARPCPFVTVSGGEVRLEYWPLPSAEPREDLESPQTANAQALPPSVPSLGERA